MWEIITDITYLRKCQIKLRQDSLQGGELITLTPKYAVNSQLRHAFDDNRCITARDNGDLYTRIAENLQTTAVTNVERFVLSAVRSEEQLTVGHYGIDVEYDYLYGCC